MTITHLHPQCSATAAARNSREREHRIASPFGRMVGKPSITDAELRSLVRKARELGVIAFLKAEIERLPDITRAVIEGEHKRLCQQC